MRLLDCGFRSWSSEPEAESVEEGEDGVVYEVDGDFGMD